MVGVSYRLLLVKYDFFSKLQNWSCFLDLVEQSANFDMHNSTSDTVEVIADIRWCGLQIISLILKLSCKATENLGITDEDAFSCLLRLVLFAPFRKLFLDYKYKVSKVVMAIFMLILLFQMGGVLSGRII